ncbi:hypothetical protein BsIDN1_70140 [Bacillus safensis]|uniref:Uncharacterized protein n=1 Tax=Bacillus safensis TaxID=561879 RepID=A0A5S9MNR0_BACIA|nr:hypothetical protein BsIDN1_70140 [Bacillus safensis]
MMAAGIIPAVFGLAVTYVLAKKLANKGTPVLEEETGQSKVQIPSFFFQALAGPLVTILLLALRPLFQINIDPMIALPIGGIVGALFMKKGKFSQ